MASLYINEYAFLARDGQGSRAPMVEEPAEATQKLAVGGSSVQSAAFGARTKILLLHADAVCSVKIGANPTAAATDMRLAVGTDRYVAVQPGQKIAVITNS